jgi:hypothetical protein
LNAAAVSEEKLVRYQHSLDLEGCVPKHRHKKPKASGIGYTGAILSDADTFCSFVELMLCYHAWCHKSNELREEIQGDMELVSFSARTVVQYFDTIIYRGDDSVDTDTCKMHSQLHTDYKYFGSLMQNNTEMGERGLKTWAKKMAKTALKHGRDVFTHSTSNRVGEMLLLNSASELVLRTQGKENNGSTSEAALTGVDHWKVPHFRFERGIQPEAELRSLDRDGQEKVPDKRTGIIQTSVLKALS